LNVKLGYDQMELISDETSVSTNPDKPTVFRSQQQMEIPKGAQALGFTFPQSYLVNTITIVQGHLVGHEFQGSFQFKMCYDKPLYVRGVSLRTITGGGTLQIYVV